MGFWEKLKNWWVSLDRLGGIELPASGRSSTEDRNSGFGRYSVMPVIDFEALALLKKLWITNPDFSQYVANIHNLGNPGHEIVVEARTPQIAERALNRLNESASRLYTRGAGVDGLLNAYFDQAAWSGAISSEDVVDIAGRRIERVALVPPEQIRFVWDETIGDYRPYQKPTSLLGLDSGSPLGLIPLNESTYGYFAVQTVDNVPYAKPPASAAIEAITDAQIPAVDNLKYVAQKIGLSGRIHVTVTPPPRKQGNTETEHEYQARAKAYLKLVRENLEGNFQKGLTVSFTDQKLETTNIATGGQGTSELFQVIEEQVFSGLNTPPAMHGRTYSTTEAFADVVYSLLQAQTGNFQRVVKRRHERTCRLDLTLGAIEVDSVSVRFNPGYSRNKLADAQVDETRFRTAKEKAESGLLTPDQAAQELGYDNWADVALLTGDAAQLPGKQSQIAKFSFSRKTQRYEFLRDSYEIQSFHIEPGSNIVPLDTKKKRPAYAG